MAKFNKPKIQSDENVRLRLPRRDEGEMFAIADKLHGTNKIHAICEDGKERMCRITGKMRKKIWIREGDVIIVKLWEIEPAKADIVWRFFGGQKSQLKRQGHLDKLPVYN